MSLQQQNIHTKALLDCIEPHDTIWFWNERKPEKMPCAFRKLGDNFSVWFEDEDQRNKIIQSFEEELLEGNVKEIYLNKVCNSWLFESYYREVISFYTEQHKKVWKDTLQQQKEISKAYPLLQEWVKEGKQLEEAPKQAWDNYLYLANEANNASLYLREVKYYCNAAIWFIESSKSIVEFTNNSTKSNDNLSILSKQTETQIEQQTENNFTLSTIEDWLFKFKEKMNESDYQNLVSALIHYFETGIFPTLSKPIQINSRLNKKLFGWALNRIFEAKGKGVEKELLQFAKQSISLFTDVSFDENNILKSNLYKYFTTQTK